MTGWCDSAPRPVGERIQGNSKEDELGGGRPVSSRGSAASGRALRRSPGEVTFGQNKGWRLQACAPGMTINPPGKNLEGATVGATPPTRPGS